LFECLAAWDALGTTIPVEVMKEGLASLRLNRRDLGGCINFADRGYQRNLIHYTEHYEVLVICWRSGQRSQIHDHGGSTCGVLMVEGVATETSFEVSRCGRLLPTRSRRLRAGALAVSRSGDIHQVANLEPPTVDLISLHVYSPRLSSPNFYRIGDTTLADHDQLMLAMPKTITVRF
jgi:cysteine dioxygenase